MADDVIISVEKLASSLEGDTARRGRRYQLDAGRSNERDTAHRDVVAAAALNAKFGTKCK